MKWLRVKTKHYNLHSGNETVKLPVQIQLANDCEFLNSMIQNDQDSDSGESCESDLNCSAVVENSDNEQVDKHNTQSTSSTSHSTSDTHTSVSDVAIQQAINVQILSQLSAISDRLQVLEKSNVKHSDPKKLKGVSKKKASSQTDSVTVPPTQTVLPDLYKIRQDAYIQCQVDQRLRDLASTENSGTKIKSLKVVPLRLSCQIGLSGLKNLYCPDPSKNRYSMTSFLLYNGWLVFPDPKRRKMSSN